MTRLAMFDCDGTLVDSQANICAAMEQAFAAADLPPPPRASIRRHIGLSLTEVIRALSPGEPEATHRALVAGYRDAHLHLRASPGFDDEPLFDGIADTLATLRADGWLLGVATGKSDRGLAHVLARHGIADLFVTLQTADRHPSKPDPAMLRAGMVASGIAPALTVMIGDTSFDMEMACAAGVRAVGVAWGYHAAQELVDAGAAVVVDHPADLPRTCSALLA